MNFANQYSNNQFPDTNDYLNDYEDYESDDDDDECPLCGRTCKNLKIVTTVEGLITGACQSCYHQQHYQQLNYQQQNYPQQSVPANTSNNTKTTQRCLVNCLKWLRGGRVVVN